MTLLQYLTALSWQDTVNGAFEFWGGVAIWGNAARLYRDKEFKGVRLDSTVFFTAWGLWNVYYYPHLDQPLSFLAGLFIVAGNAAWLSLMVRYSRPRGARRGSLARHRRPDVPCMWPDCRHYCAAPCEDANKSELT